MFASFAQYEYFLTAGLCVLALFGMGTTLTAAEFREVARRPRTLFHIAVTQLVIAPLLAIGLTRAFQLPAGIAIGLLLVTALPGGLFSNIFALLSRSHVALSISATAVCTVGSLVTTAAVLKIFGSQHLPDRFQMPLRHIVFEVLMCLLLPLACGMTTHRLLPRKSRGIGRLCIRGAMALLVFYVVAAFASGRMDLAAFGWKTHAAIILLVVLQIGACVLLSWPFRVTSLESFTAQIEVVIRNIHLGLLLKASLFPERERGADTDSTGVLFVLLYYGGASLVTGVIMAVGRRTELRIMGERHRAPPPPDLQGW